MPTGNKQPIFLKSDALFVTAETEAATTSGTVFNPGKDGTVFNPVKNGTLFNPGAVGVRNTSVIVFNQVTLNNFSHVNKTKILLDFLKLIN